MIERDFLFVGCNHDLKVFYFQLILEVKYFFEMIELTVRIRIYRRHLILFHIFQMWIISTQSIEKQLCAVHTYLRTLQNNFNLAFFGRINFNWVQLLFFHNKNNIGQMRRISSYSFYGRFTDGWRTRNTKPQLFVTVREFDGLSRKKGKSRKLIEWKQEICICICIDCGL